MNRKLLIALTASVALAAPAAAQAQTATSTANFGGTIEKACVIGDPSSVLLTIGDMTGSDGRITSTLAGSTAAATTDIQNAWCNTPSTMTLDGEPMALTDTPGYSTPSGFSRLVTYNATLSGWPTDLVDRPLVGSGVQTTTADNAHAAVLQLVISNLAALNAAGAAEAPTNVLEAGGYAGSVTVAVSVQ